MKSFQEYIVESKKTYPFTIKLCGALPESADKIMKSAMHKFMVNKLSKGKSTPIQSMPLDFPGQSNVEVHVFEVDLQYPTTSAVLTELLADNLKISPSQLRVRNPIEMAEIALNLEHNEKSGESLLNKDYESDSKAQNLVGQKSVSNFLKDLMKDRAEIKEYTGVNDQLLAKSQPKETASTAEEAKPGISPVGSRQNKIPDPIKGK
jgi:hypothetical protein